MPSVFFSYSHVDEALRDQLEKQLSMLKRQGVIETWHDRRIGAGEDVHRAIDDHINTDDIILLLVSADFIASDYCYDIEMQRAMQRHDKGEAVVIPVILRACDWHHAPFGKLKAVPRDGKPITQWPDIDEAFLQVAKAVREAAARDGRTASASPSPSPARVVAAPTPAVSSSPKSLGPRSSNLGLAKSFTQRDKDKFKHDTFEYIARFFENSLEELGKRNPGFEGVFRRVDANRFFATIYRDGKDVARGTVYLGGETWGRGINYVQGETTSSNSMNESLNVEADDQTLFLKCMGMSFGRDRDQKLSQEGAAELLWAILIAPLQGTRY
ncbi:toll/interleukin-1 receptor domain-containing protein [Sinorhizobium meliloti]|uniref:toll/interleukin-1 receptor domain-containing protein n=1 Tax=Rhizobium meliloti TaxID=382 RepID=UPI000371C412|nr:toll/interleukin-1 receptor domain-containing protein [Sinorhizobium meliloti]